MMAKEFALTKEDDGDIGFASTCLVYSVISFLEFKSWLYNVIEQSDSVPGYLFDIIDIKEKFDYTLKRQEVVGFTPSWEGGTEESNALVGVAYKRNPNYNSDAVPRAEALKALEENPHVEARFREMFPFIEW